MKLRPAARRAVPLHWTAARRHLVELLRGAGAVTGVAMLLPFAPSSDPVRYDGSYPLLQGVPVSEVYASTLHISFDVPGECWCDKRTTGRR